MAHHLIVSSQVAFGHVGLSAMAPVLQFMGHAVTALPTVLLSHHPGHTTSAGGPVDAQQLDHLLNALRVDGLLRSVSTVITGYLPTTAHVALAIRVIDAVSKDADAGNVRIICDPILGDDPGGLYIEQDAAIAIRDTLLPRADILTPNRFELSWISGQTVTDVATATRAARQLGCNTVITTSVPAGTNLGTLLVTPDTAHSVENSKRANAPHGTGDLLAGLLAGHLNNGHNELESLRRSIAGVEIALDASGTTKDLNLVANLEAITTANRA